VRVGTFLSQARKARRAMPFCEPLTVGSDQQRMMVVIGNRQLEQMLEEPMDMRREPKINAPHDVRDPLSRIVDRDSEMIADRRVLPG
jgi:hypothetical protein